MNSLLEDFNQTYPHCRLTKDVLAHTLEHDPWLDREATQVMVEGGKFIAGIFVKHHAEDPSIAHIGLLHVVNAARGQGIGTHLMRQALGQLRKRGVKTVILGQERNLLAPGLLDDKAMAFFERFGFVKTGQAFNLHRSQALGPLSVIEHPFTVRRLSADRLVLLRAVIAEHFSARWAHELDTYCQTQKHGTAFVVMEDGLDCVAFARANFHGRDPLMHNIQYAARYEQLGGIGPLGVVPTYRGQGLGHALVAHTTNILYQEGATDVLIDWTSLTAFYEALGFSVCDTFTTALVKL